MKPDTRTGEIPVGDEQLPGKPAQKVFVLCITHRHGTDVSVAATEEAALRELHVYVSANWGEIQDRVGRSIRQPKTPDLAIERYFGAMNESTDPENYEIFETPVLT